MPRGGFGAESDFRPVHLKNARVAARSTPARRYLRTGKKTQFHEAPGVVDREIDAVQDRMFPAAKISQLHATELHHGSSMYDSKRVVKYSFGGCAPPHSCKSMAISSGIAISGTSAAKFGCLPYYPVR